MLRGGQLIVAGMLLSACTSVQLGIANLPARLGGSTREAGLSYGPAAYQKLDVYRPRQSGAAPVVVYWYGGGFVGGRREQFRFVGAALAQRGVVAVLPDYAAHPPAIFPQFVDDAALAVRWVQRNIEARGGDPTRIFLMGHSAGGYLAAMLALDTRYLQRAGAQGPALRGFIALSAPHVLAPNTAVLETIFGAPWRPADWQPVGFVSASSPPALLIHGTDDTLVGPEQSQSLAQALRAAGVAVDLQLLPGLSHEATVAALSLPMRHRAPVLDLSMRFIQKRSAN
jgi:acetyl esterase/lipase